MPDNDTTITNPTPVPDSSGSKPSDPGYQYVDTSIEETADE